MKGSTLVSRHDLLICPLCERHELKACEHDSVRCPSCRDLLSGAMLETLKQVAALPDASGSHPCECGHPKMRRLPGGVFHCPACGSEVLPFGAPPLDWKSDDRGEAYWAGWLDGCFEERGSLVDNPNLARWEHPSDRLDYYRGQRVSRPAGPGPRLCGKQGSANSKAKLHERDVKQIKRVLRRGVFSIAEIARAYGVSAETISQIKHKRIWRHLK